MAYDVGSVVLMDVILAFLVREDHDVILGIDVSSCSTIMPAMDHHWHVREEAFGGPVFLSPEADKM